MSFAGTAYIGPQSVSPAPGTITGATNGLQVIGGTSIGLGGTLDLMTTIQTSNSSVLRMIPSPGEQNALLVIGATTGYNNSSYFNAIGDYFGVFQQAAMYIGDASSLTDGIQVYFDAGNDRMTIDATNNNSGVFFSSSDGISAYKVVAGSDTGISAAPLEVQTDPALNSHIVLIDTSVALQICGIAYVESLNLLRIGTLNSPIGLYVNGNNFFNGAGGNEITVIGSNVASGLGRLEIVSDPGSNYAQIALTDTAFGGNTTYILYDGVGDEIGLGSALVSVQLLNCFNLQTTQGNNLLNSQAIGVTVIGSSTTDPSAILKVDSINQGFLPPRMTQAQRLAIGSPAVGLIVYQTNGAEGLYVNTSGGWTGPLS